MSNTLFRQKSIDRISSPEELHDYMRVTSPRLWMILAAIVVLLTGFIVYASTANMENTVNIRVMIENYESEPDETNTDGERYTLVSGTLPLSMKDVLRTGMVVRIGQETGIISWIGNSAEEDVINVMFQMNRQYLPLPGGECDAELVLESTTPISFLWN